ncbi:MAG: HD domain-containing protein [Clostridia bacterium]|nr:HD domain-containing protein [Clostridia bacterium]
MKFAKEALFPENPKWENAVKRENSIYNRSADVRTEFGRDYTRIIHSMAYRRLKHKTQVFFSPKSDHICTRIEHVGHVESVSYTIGSYLGLNTELTRAISMGHDLGHAPFGHSGEGVLHRIAVNNEVKEGFWHERNSLHLVDDLELLEDDKSRRKNMNLTYAVRDGIIAHCGEVDENNLFPRDEAVDLKTFKKASDFSPYTWEGCVVKLADKISYLGRDLEDALILKILTREQLAELVKILKEDKRLSGMSIEHINNTVLISEFISDVCKNSNLEDGICLSEQRVHLMKLIKEFNYQHIYGHYRLAGYKEFAEVALNKIFDTLYMAYSGEKTPDEIKKASAYYPFMKSFLHWIEQYWELSGDFDEAKLKNKKIYNISENKVDYARAIIDYISGMSDTYAEQVYRTIINF